MGGRPSLAPVRREEILDAVGRCVARYGVEGTTLELVSGESGLSRGHIRHYLGNRDALVQAFAHRLMNQYVASMRAVQQRATAGRQSRALLRHMFGDAWGSNEDNPIIDSLLSASAGNGGLREALRGTYLTLEVILGDALRADFPGEAPADLASTAYTVLCMAFGNSTLSELAFPASRRRAVRSSAVALVDRHRRLHVTEGISLAPLTNYSGQ